jgi:hypothetical protein
MWNIITFNPFHEWQSELPGFQIKHSVAAKYIKKAIDVAGDKLWVNVRYIPFCMMKGYEKHIVGFKQVYFDEYEWNPFAMYKMNMG